MISHPAARIIHGLENGETPDFIEQEIGLSPAQQHRVVRTEIARNMADSARAMRKRKKYPFNRGLLDYRQLDCALIRLETWMAVRKMKRRYDRMNKAQKTENKETLARQIDVQLLYFREPQNAHK